MSGNNGSAQMTDSPSTVRWILVGLLALTLVLYGRGLTTSGPWYGDACNHLMNGIFIHDVLFDIPAALSDPMGFATDYYAHFPALSLGYHPPVFPIIEAFFMLLFGVSTVSAQLATLAMAMLMSVASFAWMRRFVDLPHAALGTVILTATPLLVYWGQSISLEIPTLAFLVVSAWAFEKVIQARGASWRYSMVFAVALSLAIWTKQHAIFVVPVFGMSLFMQGRIRILLSTPGIVAIGMIVIAALGILLMTVNFGGSAVSQAGIADLEHLSKRFVGRFWTYYPSKLPDMLGWPLVVLAGVGLLLSVATDFTRLSAVWGWAGFFYVSHSYPYPHAMRYACLWVPALCLLAVYGVAKLPGRIRSGGARTIRFSTLVLAGIALCTVVSGLRTRVPRFPSELEDATKTASRRLGKYSCLSLVADWPNRAAAYFRLASEALRLDGKVSTDDWGRFLRAEQVVRPEDGDWPSVSELGKLLRKWNVKLILVEYKKDRPLTESDKPLARLIGDLVASEEFRMVQQYEVAVPIDDTWRTLEHTMWHSPPSRDRTLVLYERTSPLPWNPSGGPTIRPVRTGRDMTSSASDR